MIGFLARLLGGALDPLIDKVSQASARLLRKLALFLVAATCLIVVIIALTVAFALWVASKAGAIAGVLAVAGVYLVVALVAVFFALRKERAAVAADPATASQAAESEAAARGRGEQIDAFAAPLMDLLAGLGLKREQLAVLAGSSLAKQLGPLPLVGLALLGGFLIGRMWKSWRGLLSTDGVASLLGMFGMAPPEQEPDDDEDMEEAA
ncbi:hypothetical protein RHAL1_02333 [Beijerinckiaceae bacterium RH AL1]|nr:hypothetical protein [Beijerinckiaceae bacterium]VVB46517.1 hypothetical protein RHCH11_RHCH11_02287 [Beijerinckiaceae bacterium RH CH11]VVB46602.1 hypothetical protein RHAL8_02283 [Beijerinckiaceae bacterium RH AL8]VVC55415.1 hypothetical protein RHAL1_02333 [Beijerinckiaceae bacterium RH AL1]